jgi:DNA-binding HxlR family transcriptional regulator
VYVALGVLLAGMIALVAIDDANAQYYIDAFQTLLSWPVLAFSLVMIVLLIFHSDLANVFKGYYISRVGRDAVHFEPKPQPDPPAGERPILPADDIAAQPTPQPAPDITDNDAYRRGYDVGWKLGVESANEQIETWEQEANHWWHRYLVVFLEAETRQLLRMIAAQPRNVARLLQQAEASDDPALARQLLSQSLNALDKYDLIERDDSETEAVYRITDDGRAFLTFLDSPEGDEFVRETLDERGSLPTR